MNKTEQYNYLRTVLLNQQAPFIQKDTGRAWARTRCKYSALFWNPFGTRGFTDLSIISAKSLILVVSRTGFEPVTH